MGRGAGDVVALLVEVSGGWVGGWVSERTSERVSE